MALSESHDPFLIFGPPYHIFRIDKARNFEFYMRIHVLKSTSVYVIDYPRKCRDLFELWEVSDNILIETVQDKRYSCNGRLIVNRM